MEALDALLTSELIKLALWALLPAIVAIVLALITKEVYSSLFVGILVGGLIYANGNPVGALDHVFNKGIICLISQESKYQIVTLTSYAVVCNCIII